MSEIPNTEQEMAVPTEEEKTPVETDSPPEEVSEEVVVSDEPKEDKKLDQSGRAKSRQQELANRLKDSEIRNTESEEKVNTLRTELETYKTDTESKKLDKFSGKEGLTSKPGGKEMTYDDLDRYITQKADQLVNLRLSQRDKEESRLRTFEKGVSSIESKFKELNPDSDTFDPVLSSTVAQLYRKASKANPEVDVYDFVESVMSVRDMGADKAVSEVKVETVLQEAASAVTPSSEKVVTQTDEEKLNALLKSGEMTAKDAEKYLQ